MQKLTIKNQFMGVRPCEIEFTKFLLLIGEQASGKSTIAKLIFFFQTLPDALYEGAINARQNSSTFDYIAHINKIARQRFLETFGPTSRNEGFEISFQYNHSSSLKIYQGADRMTYAEFSDSFGFSLGGVVKSYVNGIKIDIDQSLEEVRIRQILRADLDRLFSRETTQHNYIIASRSVLVGYPETFEKVIEQEYEKLLEDEVKKEDFEKRQRLGNELLLYQFVNWSKGVRNIFKNNGQTFERVAYILENREDLQYIMQIVKNVLKGQYRSSEAGEVIIPNGSTQKVALKDASSGQQEVLRLLQGIFLAIGLPNRKEFFVVEEPEAHLFPLAQKELINAFAVFLNSIPQGRMVITTHSPYVLSCINILLFANYVSSNAEKSSHRGEIAEIPRSYWLNSSYFNAYSLGQSEEYCINIKDIDTGLIAQNYLDLISEQLGSEYQDLYNLLLS
jgi:predicted ATPase